MTPEPLTPIEDAPGYATDESGRVHRRGHPRRGRDWYALRPIRELAREPGSRVFRRTGRSFFPIFRDGQRLERRYWQEPPKSGPTTPEADDDWTF